MDGIKVKNKNDDRLTNSIYNTALSPNQFSWIARGWTLSGVVQINVWWCEEGVNNTNNLTAGVKLSLGNGLVYGLLCHPQGHTERLCHAVLWTQTHTIMSWPKWSSCRSWDQSKKHNSLFHIVWNRSLTVSFSISLVPQRHGHQATAAFHSCTQSLILLVQWTGRMSR